jgi:hypothetical protein
LCGISATNVIKLTVTAIPAGPTTAHNTAKIVRSPISNPALSEKVRTSHHQSANFSMECSVASEHQPIHQAAAEQPHLDQIGLLAAWLLTQPDASVRRVQFNFCAAIPNRLRNASTAPPEAIRRFVVLGLKVTPWGRQLGL